jgi:AAA domain/DnaB-like helicase N terminal domain
MLRDNSVIAEAGNLVKADHFYDFGHRKIYEAITNLDDAGKPADIVTVAEYLIQEKLIDDVGGATYLADLWDAAPSAAHYRQYAEIIRQKAGLRRLRELAHLLEARTEDPTQNYADLLAVAEDRVTHLASGGPCCIERYTIGALIDKYPHLHEPVVDGVVRERETANIISSTKIGKSWLAYSLLLSIAAGRMWLDRFRCSQGRVLLIDNELHRPTIASRIQAVADALEIPLCDYADMIEVWPLRGNLRDIFAIGGELRKTRGLKAIVIDAKYRMSPAGKSENDNNSETQFYNAIDRYAEMTGAAIINIGHSSKGSQADKRVSDVGAGAGAQSRAADCHLILREHEDDGLVVLDAAVRSFAPVEPVALRWTFPLWVTDDGADVTKLRGRLSGQDLRQKEKDEEGFVKIIGMLSLGPATKRKLRDCGVSKDRLERLLGMLVSDGRIEFEDVSVNGNPSREYRLKA